MSLNQVLVVGIFSLNEIGDGIETQSVDAQIEPEAQYSQHLDEDTRVVVVKVGLVRIEAVPEIALRHRIPSPVGFFAVDENNARSEIFLVGFVPDIVVAPLRALPCRTRSLEPRMLIGGVVDYEFDDYPDATGMHGGHELTQVPHCPEGWV